MRTPNITDFSKYRRSRHFNPIFDIITEEFDDNFKEKSISKETIIERLYVKTPLHDEIIRLFSRGKEGLTATDEFSASIPHAADESIYILQGKKGMGKSTLLYRFYHEARRGMIDGLTTQDLVVYIDLKDRRSDSGFRSALPQSLEDALFLWIYQNRQYFKDANQIRKLSGLYRDFSDKELCQRALDKQSEALKFLFLHLRSRGHKVFMIVDNLDDFDKESLIKIFDYCHYLRTGFSVKTCLALRDYWSLRSLHIDDKPICTVMLPPPQVQKIVEKRIFSVDHAKIHKGLTLIYDHIPIALEPRDLLDIFNGIVGELTKPEYGDLYSKLYQLANYNTRDFLVHMYHFFHSPYLFAAPNFIRAIAKKIQEKDASAEVEPPRELRFHDFLQNFMAVHSLCYDKEASEVFNIFFHSYDPGSPLSYQNTLVYVRILQVLASGGSECIGREQLIRQLALVGYERPRLEHALGSLLKAALVESPDGVDYEVVADVRISPKGSIYLTDVAPEFIYLLMISDTVPTEERFHVDVDKKFGTEAIVFQRGNLSLKQESVLKFIDFIAEEEAEEIKQCPGKYAPLLYRIKGEGRDLSMSLREKYEDTIRAMGHPARSHKHGGITNYRVTSIN